MDRVALTALVVFFGSVCVLLALFLATAVPTALAGNVGSMIALGILGAIPTLFVVLGTIVWCRNHLEWRDPGFYVRREQCLWAFGIGMAGFILLAMVMPSTTPRGLYHEVPGDLRALAFITVPLMLGGLELLLRPLRLKPRPAMG